MVGRGVVDHCHAIGDVVSAFDHEGLDIANADRVMEVVTREKPDAIINCAAWTDVDGCEVDKDRAFAVNAAGPENLARASREVDAVLVTISTDYVFDGRKDGFYTQRDQPAPVSFYGLSKLEGERRAQLAHARTIVVRSGFIFGPAGSNFLSTIIQRARRSEKLKAISDAYGTPTYAPDLAMRLRELAQLDLPGIYHVVNQSEGVSFEGFARAALDLSGYSSTNLETVEMSSLKRPAPRPRNSRLKCLLSPQIGLAELPFWRDSLREFAALETHREAAAQG
jgi:dTDP-4-dehydrorhamnose reductase